MVSIELEQDLRDAIELLPEKQRRVIELRYSKDWPMTRKEVAAEMRIGVSYVQYLETQAQIRLRKLLGTALWYL